MTFILTDTDRRSTALASLLLQGGHRVLSWNGPRGAYITEISGLLEVSEPCRLILPVRASEALFEEALATLPLSSTVYGFSLPTDRGEALARRALTAIDLNRLSGFCRENAVPTAEGALAALMEHTDVCVAECTVGVVGSGRVAEALLSLLSRVGCRCVMLARDKKARHRAQKAGLCALPLPLGKKKKPLSSLDALFNTVPARGVVSRELLAALPQKTLLFELASGEGNFDPEGLADRHVIPLPALPARVAPQSAAQYLYRAVTKPKKDDAT